MSTENQPEWAKEFEKRFNRRHSQMTHIGDRGEKKACVICAEDREKNPKGYFRTYLNEQKCYWNKELYEDVESFIHSLLLTLLDEISSERKAVSELDIPDSISAGGLAFQVAFKEGYNQAKADLDAKKEVIKQKYGL